MSSLKRHVQGLLMDFTLLDFVLLFFLFECKPSAAFGYKYFYCYIELHKTLQKWSHATWNIPFHFYHPPLSSFINPKANWGGGMEWHGERKKEESDLLGSCHVTKGRGESRV